MTTEAPTISEVDCTTGVQTNRPMTPEEVSNWEAIRAEQEALRLEEEQRVSLLAALKASARAKLVAGTPLTEEEAATLVL